MRGPSLHYVVRRFGIFLLTVWVSATIIYIVPRLAPGDPVQATVARLMADSGSFPGAEQMIADWRERFGLNDPWHIQYLRFLKSAVTLDFGYSLVSFPTPVIAIIARALPWTIGMLSMAIAISFSLGTLIGSLMGWEHTPRPLKTLFPVSMIFTALPPVLAAVFLLFLFSSVLDWFPTMGAYARDAEPGFNLSFILSVIHHGALPAGSIILVSFGSWALGMRSMLITVAGEDYTTLGKAVGFPPFYLLYRFMVRNALLPQFTALALAIGSLISGAVLVEAIFNYPGMGTVLLGAIRDQDFTLIQGATLILIVTAAFTVFVMDLVYPLIDPRIQVE
ncbi:MAG TPA: ABC transporter permease [Devosiaceae bacterium]|jgi:peptide/nickel transport system permease protein|nr:ABC transporter permease [Devosiaceae bacterium]